MIFFYLGLSAKSSSGRRCDDNGFISLPYKYKHYVENGITSPCCMFVSNNELGLLQSIFCF